MIYLVYEMSLIILAAAAFVALAMERVKLGVLPTVFLGAGAISLLAGLQDHPPRWVMSAVVCITAFVVWRLLPQWLAMVSEGRMVDRRKRVPIPPKRRASD